MQEFNDEYFDDPEETETKGNKVRAKILTLLTLGVLGILGTTFALNISLGGNSIEFGQGTIQAVACAETATVTPYASYRNSISNPRKNSMIYGWVGDGLSNGGPGFSGLGYAEMDGIAGPANYVTIKVAEHIGDQTPGIPDPGNTPGNKGGVVTISGGTVAQSQSGTINADRTLIVFAGSDSASEVRILTPTAGTISVNIYRYLGGGIYSATSSETVVITVKAAPSGNTPSSEPWVLSSVQVAGLNPRCFGKEFEIGAYNSTESVPLATYVYNLSSPAPQGIGSLAKVVFNASSASVSSGFNGYSVTWLSASSFKIDYTQPVATSGEVSKVTLQSRDVN
jgi:hypothetical protein